jgi:hypothetical protein
MRNKLGSSADLGSAHERAALMKFLNDWRCRIARASFERLKSGLQPWAADWVPELPAPNTDISELDAHTREIVGPAYRALLDLGYGLRFSHTAAAKTLHALRPRSLPVWDSAIKDAFHNGSLPRLADRELYSAFIEHVAEELNELEQNARRCGVALRDIPRAIGRQRKTLVKLADEYSWVTISLGHKIPQRDQLETWLRWSTWRVPNLRWCRDQVWSLPEQVKGQP